MDLDMLADIMCTSFEQENFQIQPAGIFKMSIKAILFDLDGTLLNTLEDLADAMNRVLRARDYPTHPIEAYRYFVGNGSRMLVSRALPEGRRSREEVDYCLEAFLRDYGENWMVKTRPYAGVSAMLDGLVRYGCKIAVLSNKKDEITKKSVSRLLSRWSFDAVAGQRDEVPVKPDPTAALQIAAQLKISPDDFIYVGDSAVDMETAIAAGMFAVGALWGFRTAEELLTGGAKTLISQPEELLEVLLKTERCDGVRCMR
jgi:phosphoglycolate phosphatase